MISIIMSTHNRGSKIERSVKSILNQTYSDFEFIICDDCSTDNTYNILKKLSKEDNRIKLLKNEVNLGLQKSLNKCISASSGDYIARMDDDDFSKVNRLEKELRYLSNKGVSFVGSNTDFYSSTRGIYGEKIYPENPTKIDLIKSCQFCHPSILIKSDILKKVGGYSEKTDYYRVEDYELWLRLYSLGYSGANIQEKLLIYTKDDKSVENIRKIDRINCYHLLKEYFSKLDIPYKYYFFVIYPLVKMIIPSKIKKIINYIKYSY